MQDFYLAVLIACSCAIGWGISFFLQGIVSAQFNPATLSIIYGIYLIVANSIYVSVRHEWNDFTKLSTVSGPVLAWLAISITIDVVLKFLFLVGYRLVADSYAGVYNAISSVYPVIIFVLSSTILKQTDYNLRYAIPGLLFSTLGVILLCLSK